MDSQTQAHIYLAEQRGRLETDSFRSYHFFNFGAYVAESREPFGPLCLLNDDSLRAGTTLSMQVEQPMEVVLLPVVGGLGYTIAEATAFLEPGQAAVLSLAAGMTYQISNPYETELINCLQIWLQKPSNGFAPSVSQTNFDLATVNMLLPLFGEHDAEAGQPSGYRGFIGRYDGRQEGTYAIRTASTGKAGRIFVLILQGVFEVANRLLHERDGLALQYDHDDVLEFEALSNDALLILLDLSAVG
ncbi:pirin [Spirosoma soli]|uniref:Pirin n=1 Tax=Spirosoma soli TaxID=1770529 RepID=A0ABW5M0Q5_9BACT